MAMPAGAMWEKRNDSCCCKHKYARTSHEMGSESLLRGVDLFFALVFCFIKQEHGPPRGSKQAKTDVLLTTVLGPLPYGNRCAIKLRYCCFPTGRQGLDESWSDRWVLTVQDGFSDAFMSSDWLSTKFAAPVLIASRSGLKHPIMFRKPP